jgi:hypothetical protein
MIGYVYHVVDKITEEVVKVGSTVRALDVRWREYDKVKYSNHFLKLAKTIEDDSEDFLWHLVASEHMEILRVGTFRNGPLSNQFSPLDQKYFGLTSEFSVIGGQIAGRMMVESGHLQRISSAGGKACGAVIGKRNAESGWMREVQKLGLGLGGKIGGPKGMHTRWHVRRGIVSPACSLCKVA